MNPENDIHYMTPEQILYYSHAAIEAFKKAWWTPERKEAHYDCDRYCHCGAGKLHNELEERRELRGQILFSKTGRWEIP